MRLLVRCWVCAVRLFAASGCNKATSKPIEPPATAGRFWIAWSRPIARRKATPTAGNSRLAYRKQGADVTTQTADESVTFVRPNKVRMHCYQAIVVCDGKQLRATVADLPGQVLECRAPAELKREDLFQRRNSGRRPDARTGRRIDPTRCC